MASPLSHGAPVLSGLSAALPARLLDSSEIDRRIGKPDGWTLQASGVATRPVVGPGETQESLGCAAAREALGKSDLGLGDIDLLLFAAAVGRQPIPATAALIKRELGAEALAFPAYDVNATCLSALAALDVASLHIQAGRARHVLVVASEIASSALPWADDPATAALFGDGAAAMVVSAADAANGPRLGGFRLETYAAGYDACALPAGGTRYPFHDDPEAFARNAFFRMDGKALYRLSSAALPAFLERLLDGVGWSAAEVDLVVPHQASPHALAHIARRCGFEPDRVFDTVARTGNLVAASLPVALSMAMDKGRVAPGMKVLLIGTSAGISLGGAALQA